MEEVVKTSIEIPRDVLAKVKSIATKKGTTQNKIMNDLIAKGIEKSESKIPEHLITNKDTYNPNPERVMKMAGVIKGCKPFNAVELVREMRKGE